MKTLRWLVALAAALAPLALARPSEAHDCRTDPCSTTPPSREWRDNYLPVADAPDRHDDSRTQYQRWRDEYGCTTQFCVWVDFGLSPWPYLPPDGDPGDMTPQEAHAGAAGNHSLTEAAHQSEDHGQDCEPDDACEGIHDRHGGAAYADVCLGANAGGGASVHDPDSCDEGTKDTEFGVVIVDKNPCPLDVTFPIPCFDEYHVLRPADGDYTGAQLEMTGAWAEAMRDDPDAPRRWLCGYPPEGNSTCPV